MSFILTVVLLAICCFVLLYSFVYFIWDRHNNYLLNTIGVETVATIISKDNGGAHYDVEYNGVYYRNRISLSKNAYRKICVGERFRARILPDYLKYDHENGVTPRYVKIILSPLPPNKQDIEGERIRIESMYHIRVGPDINND